MHSATASRRKEWPPTPPEDSGGARAEVPEIVEPLRDGGLRMPRTGGWAIGLVLRSLGPEYSRRLVSTRNSVRAVDDVQDIELTRYSRTASSKN